MVNVNDTVNAEVLKWNTGRTYSEYGQRMAAMPFHNGIFVVDIDRGLSFFLPEGELNRAYIMRAYDLNAHTNYPAGYEKWGSNEWVAFNTVRRTLEELAQ